MADADGLRRRSVLQRSGALIVLTGLITIDLRTAVASASSDFVETLTSGGKRVIPKGARNMVITLYGAWGDFASGVSTCAPGKAITWTQTAASSANTTFAIVVETAGNGAADLGTSMMIKGPGRGEHTLSRQHRL